MEGPVWNSGWPDSWMCAAHLSFLIQRSPDPLLQGPLVLEWMCIWPLCQAPPEHLAPEPTRLQEARSRWSAPTAFLGLNFKTLPDSRGLTGHAQVTSESSGSPVPRAWQMLSSHPADTMVSPRSLGRQWGSEKSTHGGMVPSPASLLWAACAVCTGPSRYASATRLWPFALAGWLAVGLTGGCTYPSAGIFPPDQLQPQFPSLP